MNLFTPAEFTENYAQTGVKKASLPVAKMLLLGMLAGFLIAMGGATASTASHAITNAGLSKMVSGLLFPFGLAMVILTGAELFTGNVLINISVFSGKTGFGSMLRNWFWVYIGNFLGALLVAAAMAFLGCMNLSGGGFAVSSMKVAIAKSSLSFMTAVGLGFFCNVLVTIG
ncbi:MAG: formate/nitrite transporter family protein, partial [Succiniclasticum sp.]